LASDAEKNLTLTTRISTTLYPVTIDTMSIQLTAVFMRVPEGYAAFVEELPGANTQAETLEEARENLNEAVALVLEANRALSEQSIGGAEVIREKLIVSAA
jgi:predicted RNase H-like HicB family nuclease